MNTASHRLKLFTASNIDALDWPDSTNGSYAKRYLLPLLKNGLQSYIKNIYTDLQVLQLDDIILPLTINRYHPQNSYVCSPYNHYFAYGQEEFDKLGHPFIETSLRLLLAPLFWTYRQIQFDRVVFVNNWLLSTNLYPRLQPHQVRTISSFLATRFPDRPIVFRSVDTRGNPELHQILLDLGYRMVFSRRVYYQDVQDPNLWRKKQIKVDLAKYRRSPYRLLDGSQLMATDIPRVAQLYRALYLDGVSSYFNPQFTDDFFQLVLDNDLLTVKAFQKEGRLDAILGYFVRDGIMTQPVFGYDTYLSPKAGLYRLLSMQVALEGRNNGLLINCSAGVGEFKRLRGGIPVIEYNAVYDRHLPPQQRLPWSLLKQLLDRVAVPIIEKYEF